LLRILEDKGHVRHEEEGTRYVYRPSVQREHAKRSALRHLLDTFFEGSATQAVFALLHEDSRRLSAEDWDRLTDMIESARKQGL
jgi:predicted transcriptional regulator